MTRPSSRSCRRPALLLTAMLALLVIVPASARESRDIGNDITITAGFITEPPIQGDTNGLWVRVAAGDSPVDGLEGSLSAQVTFAGETRELPLAPAGDPGIYTSVFIPTQPGEYSFHITGSINDQSVDETFHGDPNGVPLVASRLDYEFPTAAHGGITTLAWPAGAAMILAGGAGYLIRRQRNRA